MKSQNSYETFVSNELVTKFVPMGVLSLLGLNTLFNMFMLVVEVRYGGYLTKAKLMFSSISQKGAESTDEKILDKNDMESIGSTNNSKALK